MEITTGILQTSDRYKLEWIVGNQNKQVRRTDSRQKKDVDLPVLSYNIWTKILEFKTTDAFFLNYSVVWTLSEIWN